MPKVMWSHHLNLPRGKHLQIQTVFLYCMFKQTCQIRTYQCLWCPSVGYWSHWCHYQWLPSEPHCFCSLHKYSAYIQPAALGLVWLMTADLAVLNSNIEQYLRHTCSSITTYDTHTKHYDKLQNLIKPLWHFITLTIDSVVWLFQDLQLCIITIISIDENIMSNLINWSQYWLCSLYHILISLTLCYNSTNTVCSKLLAS